MSLAAFTNQYQLSKTLRFELIPQGRTLQHIQQKGLLSRDQQRADSYQQMKKTIDAFHKHFIDLAMQQVHLSKLAEYQDLYEASGERKKTDEYKKELEKIQAELRKEIVAGFKAEGVSEIFGKLDKKELITDLLEKWIREQNDKDIYFDAGFKNFTTYFGGFHENRKNMYTDKAQSTAIAYRLIHENLPKFLDNCRIFDSLKAQPELAEKLPLLYTEIAEYLNVDSIDEAFALDYFNEVLTQKQIDVYNLIIGGRTPEEGKKKIQGLNEYINLYNQQQKDKNNRIPKFKILYKQILSDRESTSFMLDAFESDADVLDAINAYYHHELTSFLSADREEAIHVLHEIRTLLKSVAAYDMERIHVRNDTQLTHMAQKLFGSYAVFGDALSYYHDAVLAPSYQDDYQKAKTENKRNKLEKEKEKFTKQPYISLALLQKALDYYVLSLDDTHEVRKSYSTNCISDYFHIHFVAQKRADSDKEFDLIANIEVKYSCVKGVLEHYPTDRKLHQDKKTIDDIKLFLDSLMELLHFVKPLVLPPDSTLEKDNVFYGQLEPLYTQLELIIPLYNKVRNYATQKPYSTAKFKLNFENAQLLNGWDENKESDYLTSIMRKDGNYYLAIMDKQHNKVLKKAPKAEYGGGAYEKMVYKLLPGVNKMLPKVFFSKKNIDYFAPSTQLLENYKKETHKKGDSFSLHDCHTLIDFFKASIEKHEDWRNFGFQFSETATYDDLSDFYREVGHQGYKVTFQPIAENYIHELVDQGKLYLFQIYNKDFSTYSKGRPNLHTLYWKALFDPDNLQDVVYKLNGQAELFYRTASIRAEDRIIHARKQAIDNKNPLATKQQSTFEYDLIKDKRYTVDKFQFHVPITMNFKAGGRDNINQEVLAYLKNNPNVNIIGIDRGERHLIYLTLIDQQANILKQETLNTIISERYPIETPYHTLLATKEKERDAARKNWGTIENIKELKEGYLSQVVHKIANMMVEHNAIVVMEDLNFGFKRGRFKVEKQVYQKLEKMLIDKLNYLVFKDKDAHEPGGLYKALQLTSKFTSFKDLGKQSGFLFYVPAWNTSKIDPATGFVNLFDTRYESIGKAQDFFGKFDSIHFNGAKGYFEFVFDYDAFTTRAEGTRTKWTVCTYGSRIMTFRNPDANNQWDNMEIDVTQEMEDLFGTYGITYGDGSDIRGELLRQTDKGFYERLLHLFKLTLQMRNSKTGTDIDYLISPVMNARGEFYDSRRADSTQPKDADANGAYHIAKKGLWLLDQINQADDLKKVKLAVSNKEWLQFVQK